jgi:hypothetical protein
LALPNPRPVRRRAQRLTNRAVTLNRSANHACHIGQWRKPQINLRFSQISSGFRAQHLEFIYIILV